MNPLGEQHRVQDGWGYVALKLDPDLGGPSILLTAGFGFRAETCPLSPASAAKVTRHLVDVLAALDSAAAMCLVDQLVIATHVPTGGVPGRGPC